MRQSICVVHWALLVLASVACGEPIVSTEESVEDDEDVGGAVDETFSCRGAPVEHTDDCGPGCPIVKDVEVHCDEPRFGELGIHVAPAPSRTWLSGGRQGDSRLFELDAAGLGQSHELPREFSNDRVFLALDASGAPHVVADRQGTVTFGALIGSELQLEQALEGDRRWPIIDAEWDPLGRFHVWGGRASDPWWILRHDQGWNAAPFRTSNSLVRFTVDAKGEPIGFGFSHDGVLTAIRPNGNTMSLGDPVRAWELPHGRYVRVTPPVFPALEPEGAPDYVVLKTHADGLHAAWAVDEGLRELVLPGTYPVDSACGRFEDDDSCEGACEEQVEGVHGHLAAIVRTTDGRVWASWLISHYDVAGTFAEYCDEEVGCSCEFLPTERDEGWSEIALAEIDLDEEVVHEVFRLRVAARPGHATHSARENLFNMRAYGHDLAIGAVFRPDDGDEQFVRVLRIDTSLVNR